jgi:alkylation response protein AidB-like acyl-CoA dehydrogenase
MLIDLDTAHEEFRQEVRTFLDESFNSELRALSRRQAGVQPDPSVAIRWHKVLFEKGWITPTWPKEFGGVGWSPAQVAIFQDECALAGVPKLPGMGLRMCASVLLRFGTLEQKSFFLPAIRSGEHYWCQGYSEPGSGSDLASLQTRAVRDGDSYVLNGSKIWTTHAHAANWIFLLARTRMDCKPQHGISFLVAPMNTAGITVRPILSMSGEHELNQVFLDNVRIPIEDRIGKENDGWSVAKYLLESERGGSAFGPVFSAAFEALRDIAAAECADDGGPLLDDPAFRLKLAEAEIEATAIACMETRLDQLEPADSTLNYGSSLKKLTASNMIQRISELTLEALGTYARPDQIDCLGTAVDRHPIGPAYAATPAASYLNRRAVTIYGGAREIQKNILARTALGL